MKLVLLQSQLKAFDTEYCFNSVKQALDSLSGGLDGSDIILLPEHVCSEQDGAVYDRYVADMAVQYGCHVVGGSHHRIEGKRAVNTGAVAAADGKILGYYDKLRPYADERTRVAPGKRLGEFRIGAARVLVLVCADFWFSDLLFRAGGLPDVVLVPALSVTRKNSPEYSRNMWRHLAISRAYEFGVYVGISDWGYPSILPKFFASGVAGYADPTVTDPARFFTSFPDERISVFELDLDRLEEFREDRRSRGFFWKAGDLPIP